MLEKNIPRFYEYELENVKLDLVIHGIKNVPKLPK